MYLGLDTTYLENPQETLTRDQIRGLARTFDRVSRPIRVEDPRGACLYANNAAGQRPGDGLGASFEILDDADRVVARLCTTGC
jgi:hypothetical protein